MKSLDVETAEYYAILNKKLLSYRSVASRIRKDRDIYYYGHTEIVSVSIADKHSLELTLMLAAERKRGKQTALTVTVDTVAKLASSLKIIDDFMVGREIKKR